MPKWIVGLFLLCLVGCSAEPVDWHADARFTAEERTAIEEGARWLAEQSGTPVPTFDWTYEVTSDQLLRGTIRREKGPDATGECVGGIGGTVYIWPEARPEINAPAIGSMLDGLAAHELAHCTLGFVDDLATDGIMRVLSPMRWTEREQAQLAKGR